MKVLVTGATGFVGTALMQDLQQQGHHPIPLARSASPSSNEKPSWNPDNATLDPTPLEGLDAVVHLAGENVATGRWAHSKKDRIMQSRVVGTELLANTLAHLERPPKILLSASAIGYYGDQGDALLDESAPQGTDFLADVCHAWEKATDPAQEKGIRVAHLRIGLVLGTQGGALRKMLLPFRLGLGGTLGDGTAYMSWITLEDLTGAIIHILHEHNLAGPINATAPNPVTNREFTKTLGKILRRPTFFPVPAFLLRLLFGEMGQQLLLASTRTHPTKLLSAGYTFHDDHFEQALQTLLRDPR